MTYITTKSLNNSGGRGRYKDKDDVIYEQPLTITKWIYWDLHHVVADPIQVFRCSRVHSGIFWLCTPCSPRDDTAEFPLSGVEVETVERTSGISLASVAPLFSGAQHVAADVTIEPGVVAGALAVLPDPDVDLLQQVGGGAAEVDGAPADDEGPRVGEHLGARRQANGIHRPTEGDGAVQRQNGNVVLERFGVVVLVRLHRR